MKKASERILAMVLALILAAAFPLAAAADAWIPPDNNMNYALMESVYNEDACRALNAFVSNYVEANLKEFSEDSPDSTVIAATLKHLELNAGLFGSDVTRFTGDDGETYMKVSAAIFEERAKKLFGRSISAGDCPGYEDGYIMVSAENFGGPIRVFGSVAYCNYIGNGIYDLQFTVYYVDQGVTDEYSVPYYEVSDRGYRELGSGYAVFYFNDTEKTTFRSSDFQLLDLSMDAEGIPCTNENLPMAREDTHSGATEPTDTEIETEPETTEAPSEHVPVQTEPQPTETPATERPSNDLRAQRGSSSGGMVLLIVLLVIVIALLALSVILLVYNNRRR